MKLGIYIQLEGFLWKTKVWDYGNFIDAFSAVRETPLLMLRWVVTAGLA